MSAVGLEGLNVKIALNCLGNIYWMPQLTHSEQRFGPI